MFLNIQIDLIILKTYDKQFTFTSKKNHCISSLNLNCRQASMGDYRNEYIHSIQTECHLIRVCIQFSHLHSLTILSSPIPTLSPQHVLHVVQNPNSEQCYYRMQQVSLTTHPLQAMQKHQNINSVPSDS